jgi:hypothetical protein
MEVEFTRIRIQFRDLCQTRDAKLITDFLQKNATHIASLFEDYLSAKYIKKIIECFLQQNINFTKKTLEGTYLHMLLRNPHYVYLYAVEGLVQKKINLNAGDWKRECALSQYIRKKKCNIKIVKYILENGYNIQNVRLHNCVHHDVFKLLLQHNADPNLEKDGKTVLQARPDMCERTIRLFVKHGYDINMLHSVKLTNIFIWTFRMHRNFNYDLKWYREYVAGELDFRDPHLDRGLKRVAQMVLCVFKRLRVTRHIAYICLDYAFYNIMSI